VKETQCVLLLQMLGSPVSLSILFIPITDSYMLTLSGHQLQVII
jgi:hypothetical protein